MINELFITKQRLEFKVHKTGGIAAFCMLFILLM